MSAKICTCSNDFVFLYLIQNLCQLFICVSLIRDWHRVAVRQVTYPGNI
jgi:hypothetical protein